MSLATYVGNSKVEANSLCDDCLISLLLDDSQEEFFPGTLSDDDSTPSLRHVDENASGATAGSPRIWDDDLPGLPAMTRTAEAGCRICQFLSQALLRKQIKFQGPVQVCAKYIWGLDRDIITVRDDGLVNWECIVYDGEEELCSIDFNIETESDEISEWLRMDKKRRPTPLDPRNVKWMTDQIRQCEEACHHTTSDRFLPTRLVNVGAQDGDDALLVITADLIKTRGSGKSHGIKYATLSYCWGPEEDAKQQVKTTKDNISSHLKAMPLHEMSPVVNDAILVCRALGIEHIWIDALCILQGDSKDWDKESEMMGKVYYCSHLTICPLSSSSCMEGFLGSRALGVDIEFQSSRQPDIRGTYSIFECIDKARSICPGSILCKELDEGQSSWTTRGWAFQESILSLRILFFGASMCHFFCEGKEVSENGYFTDRASQHCGGRLLLNSPPRIPDINDYDRWNRTQGILRKKWTYREDFLPGLSGLAKGYATVINDVYIAGHWKNNLQYSLTWKVNWPDPGDLDSILQRNRQQSPYIAPSWSWASQEKTVERSIDFSYSPRIENINTTRSKPWKTESSMCHPRSEFTLKDFEMELWGDNPFGRLKGGFIKISGKVVPFPSEVLIRSRTSSGRWEFGYFVNGLGTCRFDWTSQPNTVQEPGKMRLLPTSSCCSSTSNWEHNLWRANPEDDPRTLHRTFMESNPLCRVLEDWVRSEDCRCCNDKELARNAWGIIIHPADEPDSYYRVGVFLLPAYSGGSNLFKGIENEMVKLM